MSYILDALRRADAERSRGSVPHLHAPMPGLDLGAATQPAPSALRRYAGWLVAAAALAVAGVAWWRTGAAPKLPAVPMAPPAASGPIASGIGIGPAVAPTLGPASAPNPAGASAGVPGVALAPPAPARSADAARPVPPPPPRPPSERPPVRQADEAPPPRPATPPRDEAQGEARRAAAAPLPHRRDLPPALQQALPPLGFGGTVYASRPTERMVVINGEVWREGDRIAPGVVVEEIRRKDAILSVQGQRFVLAP